SRGQRASPVRTCRCWCRPAGATGRRTSRPAWPARTARSPPLGHRFWLAFVRCWSWVPPPRGFGINRQAEVFGRGLLLAAFGLLVLAQADLVHGLAERAELALPFRAAGVHRQRAPQPDRK